MKSCERDSKQGNIKLASSIPDIETYNKMNDLSGNSISRVWRVDDCIYKQQPKYLCDNEVYALGLLRESGIVPSFRKIDAETIIMERLVRQNINDPITAIRSTKYALHAMEFRNIRHGDLTKPHIFFHNNKIKIIDWGESRLLSDPREDKRPEGDKYWLYKSVKEILREQESSFRKDVRNSKEYCEFMARKDNT